MSTRPGERSRTLIRGTEETSSSSSNDHNKLGKETMEGGRLLCFFYFLMQRWRNRNKEYY